MTYIIIVLVVATICALLLFHKHILRLIAEKKALPEVEKVLFTHKQVNKAQVLQSIHSFTNNRLSNEMAMDYFYKIKGLQMLNTGQPINFWIKTYLTTPPKIKLNYFEQVKFYETFLNYPRINKEANQTSLTKVRTHMKAPIIRKLAPQKMA
ncbi:hypothetical protein SAMN06265379_1112 [Saccharicrinis carchari]|uniref:Uncharacterized protein n=1 Tax=Saccharicrinis carchari TaxID=1168039 RepID=A0A521ESL7_SACCC|nr:hypothetical protein [Saccharicrinis carchari]SMO86948.1 hypothetical protein SAMN06265379_1112 [Saccharicrinis carchari]